MRDLTIVGDRTKHVIERDEGGISRPVGQLRYVDAAKGWAYRRIDREGWVAGYPTMFAAGEALAKDVYDARRDLLAF